MLQGGAGKDVVYLSLYLHYSQTHVQLKILIWLLSIPACGEVHTSKAMQDITGVDIADAEATHKGMTHAQLLHESNDLQLIIDDLLVRKPFGMDSKELCSLSNHVSFPRDL